ncbi:ion channel [Deinococcus sp. KNUC1210]|uniref:ion channel n=1 Tax=Deinococcus sp. KNUC1210 TaxID=2917691 RepID=UPI001EEFB2FB|nr:ion channel [Deinococcus sp. KNUC1210]ULH15916.1 ion channel [Deinococcus sp. KNUC1210]
MTHTGRTGETPLTRAQPAPAQGNVRADLGLSGAVADASEERFLNRDGSFNVLRQKAGWESINLYGELLTASWSRFFTLMVLAYLALNALFACAYDLLGPSALSEMPAHGFARFMACFFFSVQTFGTIGFGHVYPNNMAANLVVTFEAFVGLLGVALATGILFARFSRPVHRVLFSDFAVFAPYRGGQALMFRVMNGHRTHLFDLNTEVVMSHYEDAGGRRVRQFHPLQLERESVTFFPTSWTIVHPITESSPFWGQTEDTLRADDLEVLVVLRALDDASHQQIHARCSYKATEMVWNARFRGIHSRDQHGHLRVDVSRLSDIERLESPPVRKRVDGPISAINEPH